MKPVPIIRCSDLRRSITFYTAMLGFEPKEQSSHLPGPVVVLVRNSAELELSILAGDNVFGTSVYINVEDVDALFQEFTEKGLKMSGKPESPVHQAPVDQTWGTREFYVTDPDGNTLRFRTPIK